ncbi:MAG TPA: alpha/beta fold hydrolase [Candidatus Limnocylindria bacterium]|nr:alpha/beta fold hydrolase [Candidatus Limnocylindria bacterium]
MPRLMAGSVELFYESLGEGTPLVLQAHDHTPWLFGQAPVFSQRYRFLTYDRRGTGRSASPPGGWSAADLANDLAGLLDALGIPEAIVGGSSLGGVVTAQFAVDHPGRAQALVIGHTVPYVDDEGRRWLEEEIANALAGRPPIVRQPRSSPADTEGPPTTDPAFAASAWGAMMARTGTGLGRTPDERARAIAVLRHWDQRPRKADLAKIDVPTLVIVGEREPRSTVEGAREWASWIPGAELVVLPGAHHAAPREAAPAWNEAVQAFLDRHGLSGREPGGQ